MVYYKTKFYSFWTMIDRDDARVAKNDATYMLQNELETVLGDGKLLSMTSAPFDGGIVTTIAFQEEVDPPSEVKEAELAQ